MRFTALSGNLVVRSGGMLHSTVRLGVDLVKLYIPALLAAYVLVVGNGDQQSAVVLPSNGILSHDTAPPTPLILIPRCSTPRI